MIDYRLAFLARSECLPTVPRPHTHILKVFAFIGTPHQK
jgi:hypothetical protein